MTALIRFIPDNPVLTKELRVRMRGARAYWILLGYLGFLAVLVLLRYFDELDLQVVERFVAVPEVLRKTSLFS